jgi:L-fucose mutarotase
MLKNINPLIGPDLLRALAAMGHGDEVVIADRNFPSYRVGSRVVELRGHPAALVVEAVCSLLPLDSSVKEPVLRMSTAAGPDDIPDVHAEVIACVEPHLAQGQVVGSLDRFAFYDRAEGAYLVVVTGESRPYGDFVLVKGVL